MDEPREVQVYQSANRPNLMMGCDREMVLLVGLLCAALVFSVGKIWAVAVGIGAWMASIAVLSRMAKADPLMRQIYIRHVRYQGFYPAKSALRAEALPVTPVWK